MPIIIPASAKPLYLSYFFARTERDRAQHKPDYRRYRVIIPQPERNKRNNESRYTEFIRFALVIGRSRMVCRGGFVYRRTRGSFADRVVFRPAIRTKSGAFVEFFSAVFTKHNISPCKRRSVARKIIIIYTPP